MPGSDGKKLSDLLRTKDPEMIKEAMASIVAEQADIVDEQLAAHKVRGQDAMEPDLMKNINSLFGNADKLHRLIAPKAATQINIGIGGQAQAAVTSGDPRQIASIVYRELEEQNPGMVITEDMVRARIRSMQQPAIEATVINGD